MNIQFKFIQKLKAKNKWFTYHYVITIIIYFRDLKH